MAKEDELLSFLTSEKPRRVGILCHKNADPDSFCSAYALGELLSHLEIESSIIMPEGLSEVSKHLLPQYGIQVNSPKITGDEDAFILVDICSLDQIGDLAVAVTKLRRPIIVVDHHAETADLSSLANFKFIEESAVSVGELVYRLYLSSGITPSIASAKALLAAIIYDSRHLMRATPKTLETVLGLMSLGVNYDEVVQSLHVPVDVSERIARLKAAQRIQFERANGFLIAATRIGSFEASAARSLIDLGADVAIVVGGEKEALRISARAREEFYGKTQIHLGRDILEKLGLELGGGGGGHPTAAGASGVGDPDRVLKECIRRVLEAITKTATNK